MKKKHELLVKRLSDKQTKFVKAYLENPNDLKGAAIKAGVDPDQANAYAYQTLRRKNVQEYIQQVAEYVDPEMIITMEWKLKKLFAIVNKCAPDDPNVPLKDQAPSIAIQAISELNKMQGHLAPTKSINASVQISIEKAHELKELIDKYTMPY